MSTTIFRGYLLLTALALAAFVHAAPLPLASSVRVAPADSRTVAVEMKDMWVRTAEGGYSSNNGPDSRVYVFSPDGRFVAVRAARTVQLELYDTDTGKSLGKFGPVPQTMKPAFFPDGKTLLVIGPIGNRGCCVEVWDIEKRKCIRSLDEDVNQTQFDAAAVSPDGKMVVLAGRGQADGQAVLRSHFWDAATGDELRVGQGGALALDRWDPWQESVIDGLCFAPNGRSLALVARGPVTLVEAATGKERCVLGWLAAPHRRKRDSGDDAELFHPSLAWSPDGRTLAAGCADGAVRLWDVVSGREYAPLAGHAGPVRCLMFGRDGKTLRSFGGDNRVLSWPLDKLKLDWLPRRDKLGEAEFDGLWEALAGEDILARHIAITALADVPGHALPFLRQRLEKVPRADTARLRQLLADLPKEDFNGRKKIAVELGKHGEAVAALWTQLKEEREGQRLEPVVERVLNRLVAEYPTDRQLRDLRALEALARMDTEDARQFLKELTEGEPAALLTREARAVLSRRPVDQPSTGKDVAGLWKELESEDSRRAFAAVRALAAHPKESVSLLRERLKTPAALDSFDDPESIARLVVQLDDADFNERERASKELARLGRAAVPALRKALEDRPSAEQKVRAEALLRNPAPASVSPVQLQAERALEALELIGGNEARHALTDLGREAKNRALKAAVTDTLRRLRD